MKQKHGFTLIELLTVVIILATLTAVALPQYRKSVQRAEAASALVNLRILFDGAKRYYVTHSTWPTSFNGLDVKFLDQSTDGDVGEFRYALNANKSATACRIANASTSNTYCLIAWYRLNEERDVYQCQYNSNKYQALCDSFGESDGTNLTRIGAEN